MPQVRGDWLASDNLDSSDEFHREFSLTSLMQYPAFADLRMHDTLFQLEHPASLKVR